MSRIEVTHDSISLFDIKEIDLQFFARNLLARAARKSGLLSSRQKAYSFPGYRANGQKSVAFVTSTSTNLKVIINKLLYLKHTNNTFFKSAKNESPIID